MGDCNIVTNSIIIVSKLPGSKTPSNYSDMIIKNANFLACWLILSHACLHCATYCLFYSLSFSCKMLCWVSTSWIGSFFCSLCCRFLLPHRLCSERKVTSMSSNKQKKIRKTLLRPTIFPLEFLTTLHYGLSPRHLVLPTKYPSYTRHPI